MFGLDEILIKQAEITEFVSTSLCELHARADVADIATIRLDINTCLLDLVHLNSLILQDNHSIVLERVQLINTTKSKLIDFFNTRKTLQTQLENISAPKISSEPPIQFKKFDVFDTSQNLGSSLESLTKTAKLLDHDISLLQDLLSQLLSAKSQISKDLKSITALKSANMETLQKKITELDFKIEKQLAPLQIPFDPDLNHLLHIMDLKLDNLEHIVQENLQLKPILSSLQKNWYHALKTIDMLEQDLYESFQFHLVDRVSSLLADAHSQLQSISADLNVNDDPLTFAVLKLLDNEKKIIQLAIDELRSTNLANQNVYNKPTKKKD